MLYDLIALRPADLSCSMLDSEDKIEEMLIGTDPSPRTRVGTDPNPPHPMLYSLKPPRTPKLP